MQESQWKQIRLVERSRPANFKHHFHCWCKQITMWCKSLTLEKYISFRMKWFFWPPFLSVSPFLLLNLARRQCYAYAIGLYTRPEIKSWPDVKVFAHAQCVLPRCLLTLTCLSLPSPFFSLRWRSGENRWVLVILMGVVHEGTISIAGTFFVG